MSNMSVQSTFHNFTNTNLYSNFWQPQLGKSRTCIHQLPVENNAIH